MAHNIVQRIDETVPVKHVLISVSDKRKLEFLVPELISLVPDIKILSTGGTFRALEAIIGDKASKTLIQVSDYTGQPEMQGGLVKTLDFKIYLGLLSETYNNAHTEDLKRCKAVAIDMVVVNLYPFVETIAQADATMEHARTNIDIGGPCMIRAAAKNFIRVAAVTDPQDYDEVVRELRNNNGGIPLETRFKLSQKAFAHTASYDQAISSYFASSVYDTVKTCYKQED